ncbi:hypothetical protein [Streptomyces sp. NRRL S-237]|uniref:hypothetical protein n=1 Tax=Streptomyces sp. NRRL S-237 TaxID=1463895 RepID=UPI0004CBB49D|nr:hypothetical protein [Streptomyces sp. NRRL S-237]
MYSMLPLTTSDWDPLADLVHRRNDHEKRIRTATTDGSSLLRLAADPQPDIQLIGMWEDAQLVGAFALAEGADAAGWTEDERAEQSWMVRLAFTDPDHNRLGRLATLWIGDYAARQNTPPLWIRCAVPDQEVAWYLERQCGWALVRTARDKAGYRNFLLQRAPERIEHFDLLVTTGAELAIASVLSRAPLTSTHADPKD